MSDTIHLQSPLALRGLTLKNRMILAPMCQFSATDGLAGEWHLRHYAERAVGGAALSIVEATAVRADGRITPGDLGLWNEDQVEAFRPVTRAIRQAGGLSAVQLAHAGRKASTAIPWQGVGALPEGKGGWCTVSAGTEPFDANYPVPDALDEAGIRTLVDDFAAAAERAVRAGFDAVEIHGAHGYLIHQFLSPLTNRRNDRWGGSPENRFRLLRETARAVRRAIPEAMPLLVRLSATDWVEGGWDLDQTVALVSLLKEDGVDFADISTGGLVPKAAIPVGPGYQVPLAAAVKERTGLATGVAGLITDAAQIDAVLGAGQADAVLLGRLLLRDPYFPLRALPADSRRAPVQYSRAF